MITENFSAYPDGGSHKEFNITVSGTDRVITNERLLQDSIKLDEALCSEQNLKYGSCEASQLTLQVANSDIDFKDKTLTVTVTMDGVSTKYGTFKVQSDKPTADRIWRVLTAYDAMYDIINTDVSEWYKGLTFPMTIRAFRDSFFSHLGITQKTVTLINDVFETEGGFSVTGALSGKTIITAICEFNGVFGHINRNGQFEYVSLSNSSFECPPYENNAVTYEDYVTEKITKVTMNGSTSDVGTSVGTDGNEYVITGNPLIYGKEGSQELIDAVTNLLNKIKNIQYRPYTVSKTIGNPCVELGDKIVIETKYQTVESYVIKRTLSGIQALRDVYSASGDKTYPAIENNITGDLQRVLGKTNELTRTVEETVSTVASLEETVDGHTENISTLQQDAQKFVLSVNSNGKVAMMKLENAPNASSNFEVVADNINLDGYNIVLNGSEGITITSPNFSVTKQGVVTMTGANVSGDITANSLTLGTNASVPSGKVSGLAAVATSGSASDVSGLATVATSGNYNDLSNKPTIPSTDIFIAKDGTIGTLPPSGSTSGEGYQGFKVASDGLMQAANAIIYGKLYSSEGLIGGVCIAQKSIGTAGFIPCDKVGNYTRYKSVLAHNVGGGRSRATIKLKGYTKFVVVIRSEAEGQYDYTVAGILDKTNIDLSTSTSNAQGHTSSKQGTNVAVTYTTSDSTPLTTAEHTIEILYGKDGSVNTEPDCGWFYVDESQCSGNSNRSFEVDLHGYALADDGTLYASGAKISGDIIANSLTLGSDVSIPADDVSGLSTVATTGNYNDLTNKPTIPSTDIFVAKDGTIGTLPPDGSTSAEGYTGFKVASSGLLKVANAVVWGTIYASAGLIGGVKIKKNIIVAGLESADDNYIPDFVPYDYTLEGYLRYRSGSQSYHKPSSISRIRITLKGYTKFVVGIYSDAESNYDYTLAGQLDQTNLTLSSAYQASTKGKQKQVQKATYTISNSSTEHTIEIIYGKDSSADNGEDRGYFWVVEGSLEGSSDAYYKIDTGNFTVASDGSLCARNASIIGDIQSIGDDVTEFAQLKDGNLTLGQNSRIDALISRSPVGFGTMMSSGYKMDSVVPRIVVTVGEINGYAVHLKGSQMGRKVATVTTSPNIDTTVRVIGSITIPIEGTYVVTGIIHASTAVNLQAGVGVSSSTSSSALASLITQRSDNTDWLTVTRVINITSGGTTVYLVGRANGNATAASGTLIEYVKVN